MSEWGVTILSKRGLFVVNAQVASSFVSIVYLASKRD